MNNDLNCTSSIIYTTLITLVIIMLFTVHIYNILYEHYPPDKRYYVQENPDTKKINLDDVKTSPSENTKNVTIFISHDYKTFPEYGIYTKKIMQKYCDIHGYTFLDMDHKNQNVYAPYWLKIYDLYTLSQKLPNDAIIMYMDVDASITPSYFDVKLDNVLNKIDKETNKKWDMYVPIDPGSTNFEFNAGIIVIRNTDWIKQFLSLYLQNYPKGFWKKNEMTQIWDCQNCTDICKKCTWAGDEYEQGMLNRLYYRNVMDAKNYIIPVSLHIFGNRFENASSYIIHMMAMDNNERLKYFKHAYESIKNK